MAQQRTMDVTANNIANSSTPGYKSEHVLFSDWLVPRSAHPGTGQDRAVAFAQDHATWRDQSAGSITQTGAPLDLAMTGKGFFSVQTPSGVRLTRAGRFTLGADGVVADESGNALLDSGGTPITINPGDGHITVASDGSLSTDHGQVAKVGVVQPTDLNRISAEGSRLFRSDSATAAVTRPGVVQGAVEQSNVSPMIEMSGMMQLSRDFQLISQFVQSEADRQQSSIDKMTQEPQP